MDKFNEKKDSNLVYYMLALVGGVVIGYLLIFAFEMVIIIGRVLIKYWWGVLIGVAIILFIRWRKKK